MSTQHTALLLQGPDERGAEMEDVRIALGILGERGWSVERLNIPPQLLITATPISLEGPYKALTQRLAEEEAERVKLREACVKLEMKITERPTYSAAFSLCAFFAGLAAAAAYARHPSYALIVAFGCSLTSIALKKVIA